MTPSSTRPCPPRPTPTPCPASWPPSTASADTVGGWGGLAVELVRGWVGGWPGRPACVAGHAEQQRRRPAPQHGRSGRPFSRAQVPQPSSGCPPLAPSNPPLQASAASPTPAWPARASFPALPPPRARMPTPAPARTRRLSRHLLRLPDGRGGAHAGAAAQRRQPDIVPPGWGGVGWGGVGWGGVGWVAGQLSSCPHWPACTVPQQLARPGSGFGAPHATPPATVAACWQECAAHSSRPPATAAPAARAAPAGAGSSMCAVAGGRCVDTTMGLTPLEGLMMGTRCGAHSPFKSGSRRRRLAARPASRLLSCSHPCRFARPRLAALSCLPPAGPRRLPPPAGDIDPAVVTYLQAGSRGSLCGSGRGAASCAAPREVGAARQAHPACPCTRRRRKA